MDLSEEVGHLSPLGDSTCQHFHSHPTETVPPERHNFVCHSEFFPHTENNRGEQCVSTFAVHQNHWESVQAVGAGATVLKEVGLGSSEQQ